MMPSPCTDTSRFWGHCPALGRAECGSVICLGVWRVKMWPSHHTNLAGLGIDVAHAEKPSDHIHVLFLLNGCQCCQHQGGVPSFVLVVHVTDPCGSQQRGLRMLQGWRETWTKPCACLPLPVLPKVL